MCSMYNHSDNYNVAHNQDPENMIYTAARDIKKGEELYVNYGQLITGTLENNNLCIIKKCF